MPQVIVKLWPGKSDEQKQRLSHAVVRDVTSILNYGDQSVSVAFEEVAARESKVYDVDIVGSRNQLTKQPGYDASDLT
jgi:4-oxalocrotonate tautomerase